MTKQELLTKLATECATWEAASFLGRAEAYSQSQNDPSMSIVNIQEKDWLAERKRLLDKPSWKDAPASATHLAMCKRGYWYWLSGDICIMPGSRPRTWMANYRLMSYGHAKTIPAGYDWRDSLEERPV